MIDQKTPLAAAIFATLYPAAQALAQEQRREARPDPTRARHRHGDAAQREPAGRPAERHGALDRVHREAGADEHVRPRRRAALRQHRQLRARARTRIVMRGIATGTGRVPHRQPGLGLPRRAADDLDLAAGGRAPDRHRARRSCCPGPQGTLFGSSAQAGTLHYVTNKPDVERLLERGRRRDRHDRRAASQSYDVSGWVNMPVSDNFARARRRVSGRRKAATSTTSSARPDGRRRPMRTSPTTTRTLPQTGGRVAGLWTINPDWNLLATGIYQRGDTMGTWETDPFLGDNKITRFFDEWRDDEWYTTSATLKGDLGFAELSRDRGPISTARSTTSGTTRTTPSGAPSTSAPIRTRLYDTGTLHSDDLQLPEAEPLVLRSAADLAGRQQAASGWPAPSTRTSTTGGSTATADAGDLTGHAGLGRRRIASACERHRRPTSRLSARADADLLLQQVSQQGEAARLLRRDDLRPDRQVVGHRRRALVRVRPRHVRHVPGSARLAGQKRSRRERPDRAKARTATRRSSSRRSTTSLPT